MAVYLAANAAYLRVLPIDVIADSPLVASDVMVRLVGPIGSSLIAALVCVSTFGSLNAVLMAIPRVFWAMADDGLFFRAVAAVHPRYRTPHIAIVTMALLAILYMTFHTFEQLIEAFILASLPFWALSVASVIVLRRRQPTLPRPYRTPGYPVVPLVFVTVMLALAVNSLREHPEATAASIGAVLAGVRCTMGGERSEGGGEPSPGSSRSSTPWPARTPRAAACPWPRCGARRRRFSAPARPTPPR